MTANANTQTEDGINTAILAELDYDSTPTCEALVVGVEHGIPAQYMITCPCGKSNEFSCEEHIKQAVELFKLSRGRMADFLRLLKIDTKLVIRFTGCGCKEAKLLDCTITRFV